MHIEFQCEKCGKKLHVPEGQEGKTLKCPNCEDLTRVPRPKQADDAADPGVSSDTKTLRNPASIRHANRKKIRELSEAWEAISVEMLPEAVVVSFAHGDLRGHVFETRLEKELQTLSQCIPEHFLVMDFTAVEYVPSRVISIFITVAGELRNKDIDLRFYGMNKAVTKTMEMVGLKEFVSFYPNRAAALKDIAEEHNKKVHTRREKRLGHDKTSLVKDVGQSHSPKTLILAGIGVLALLILIVLFLSGCLGS